MKTKICKTLESGTIAQGRNNVTIEKGYYAEETQQ